MDLTQKFTLVLDGMVLVAMLTQIAWRMIRSRRTAQQD